LSEVTAKISEKIEYLKKERTKKAYEEDRKFLFQTELVRVKLIVND
jgi:hypothetical protein